jgi:peptidoglycan/LPS O-acetylase OafA/YrhL
MAEKRLPNLSLWIGVIVGAAIWIATMASAPRVSDDPNESSGSPALWPLLALTALVLGYFEPRRPALVALAVVLAPLVLAPVTAPRGDEDGLWVLIIPMLAVFGFFLFLCAHLSGWVRRRVDAPNGNR